MKVLILISARGGSKGIPGKNIKDLAGKPLIYYSIDIAKAFLDRTKIDGEICISTDDFLIQKAVKEYGVATPFVRPESLATDTSTTIDVILHALNYYKDLNIAFNYIILLQPTSPFRRLKDLLSSWKLIVENSDTDAVISVFDSGANPYYNMVELTDGFIKRSKSLSDITRRQDSPKVYQLNGAIYILNVESFLRTNSIMNLHKIKMIEMSPINSIDIDYQSDWDYCEYLINSNSILINELINP